MKSVKLQEVKEAESQLSEGVSGMELFWEIFNHDQLAIALTDEHGQVVLSNSLFIKTVIEVPVRPDFLRWIHQAGQNSTQGTSHVDFNTGNYLVNLSFFRLPGKPKKIAYVWVAAKASAIHHRMDVIKNLYRSFIDTSFELLLRTTSDGKILFANQLFIRSFGIDNYRKIKDAPMESIFEDQEQYKEVERRLLIDKKIQAEKIFFRKVDNSRLTGLVNGHVHYNQKGIPVIDWTILDISRQIESETALKNRNDELAKVNHQMEKFLYSTSHDLRSPITSILGLINLLRMESKDAVVIDYASKIEASTFKLDKIIRDIMSFSKATYQRMESENIDFETLTWKVINNYRSDPAARRINFEVKSKGGFPFYSDPERVEIIVENIIRNAIHFYDANKVRSFVRVNVTTERTHAQIEIVDNGIGIGKQHMESVFNMFYKASHLSKGAGLGLYIVKETVEKLGGTITFESEIGFGTMFRIVIPNHHKGRLIGRKLQLKHQV